MLYDYKNGLNRIRNILDSPNEVEVIDSKIPKDENQWSFKNGKKAWVSAIFVDIVDSTKLFTGQIKDTTIAKMMRAFCSEIIRILKIDENYRQIGIRGDCVYGIYSTPNREDLYEIYNTSVAINTFMGVLNKELKSKSLPCIEFGIGIAASESLIIKAGVSGESGSLNDKIWIGESVSFASKLSSVAGRSGFDKILISENFYINLIIHIKELGFSETISWFKEVGCNAIEGKVYEYNLINIEINNWLTNNYQD
ncbi:adenylate/guanylate cyclase domain-containing protein [Spiroplasma endosymbiont of Othius punctulatus]|uniref:adenylate/guanylate cyclase domain-containing protein n=1 Tax=Spiroplasma endosymbiont of Othius punctulatus TaxID=3066289 RepID=UPI0030D1DC16